MCKHSVISQKWLKIEVKLLLIANRKSYIPRRLAQQRMILSDLSIIYKSLPDILTRAFSTPTFSASPSKVKTQKIQSFLGNTIIHISTKLHR